MDSKSLLLVIITGAIVSFIMRVIPLIFCKDKIKSQFINSFLYYVPYAVMTSITIPAIFTCTSSIISAIVGSLLTILLCFLGQGMLVNAVVSVIAVYIVEKFVMHLF